MPHRSFIDENLNYGDSALNQKRPSAAEVLQLNALPP
jgi:hypothetical protein